MNFLKRLINVWMKSFMDNWNFKINPVTKIIMALNYAVFITTLIVSHQFNTPTNEVLVKFGGAVQGGPIWSALTCNFLHGFWIHIILNMMTLKNYGRMSENKFGSVPFAFFYLAICILSGLVMVIYGKPGQLVVGSSMAICGLIGSQIVFFLFNKNSNKDEKVMFRLMLVDVVIIGGISLLPFVSAKGHITGFITGAALTALFCLVKNFKMSFNRVA